MCRFLECHPTLAHFKTGYCTELELNKQCPPPLKTSTSPSFSSLLRPKVGAGRCNPCNSYEQDKSRPLPRSCAHAFPGPAPFPHSTSVSSGEKKKETKKGKRASKDRTFAEDSTSITVISTLWCALFPQGCIVTGHSFFRKACRIFEYNCTTKSDAPKTRVPGFGIGAADICHKEPARGQSSSKREGEY